jgi:hypothetical protein
MRKRTETLVVDRMVSAYDWREACHVVDDAYRSWTSATRPHASVAFERYNAALDAEQRAADTYAALVRRVEHLVASDGDPFGTLAA